MLNPDISICAPLIMRMGFMSRLCILFLRALEIIQGIFLQSSDFSTHTLSPDSVIFVCTKNLSWRHPHRNQRSIHMNALRTSSTNLLPAGRRRGRNKMGTSSDDDNLSGEEQEIKLHCLEMDGSDAEDAPFDEIMSENSENSDKSEDINTDTDDDTLTDILGGPYAPPEQREETTVENDATVVHLKYIIPKEIPIEESVSKHSRMRNPFRRLSFMRGKDKESDATHSTSPKPKFKAPKLFRRKKKRCSSEDSPTTSTTTSESMLLAGDYPRVSVGLLEIDSEAIARKEAETEVTVRDMKKSTSKRAFGSRLEWTKTSGNSKRMFRIRSFRRKGAKTKSTASSIALEGSSDASSIFSKCSYSFDSGSEIISFHSNSSSDDAGDSLFSDFIHTLDDLASFRFLGDQYGCDTYGEPESIEERKPKAGVRRTGYC